MNPFDKSQKMRLSQRRRGTSGASHELVSHDESEWNYSLSNKVSNRSRKNLRASLDRERERFLSGNNLVTDSSQVHLTDEGRASSITSSLNDSNGIEAYRRLVGDPNLQRSSSDIAMSDSEGRTFSDQRLSNRRDVKQKIGESPGVQPSMRSRSPQFGHKQRGQMTDTAEFLARERKAFSRKETFRRVSWQLCIFTLCFIKLLMACYLQGVVSLQRPTLPEFSPREKILKLCWLTGIAVSGMIYDNISSPRKIAVGIQLLLGLTWIGTGLRVRFGLT